MVAAVRKSEVCLWMGTALVVGPILVVIGRWFYLMHEQDAGLFWVVMILLGYLSLIGLSMSLHNHYQRKERGY
jgi:hypothetical protein